MKPFGSKRTYAKCRVVQAGFGRKIKVRITVKSRKADRAIERGIASNV